MLVYLSSVRCIDLSNNHPSTSRREIFLYNWVSLSKWQESLRGNAGGIKCCEEWSERWIWPHVSGFPKNLDFTLTVMEIQEERVMKLNETEVMLRSCESQRLGLWLFFFRLSQLRSHTQFSVIFEIHIQKDDKVLKHFMFFAFFFLNWPGNKNSHIRHRSRCPDGCEMMAEFLRFLPQWQHLSVERVQMTGGSGTPLSRSEGPTHPRTACSLPSVHQLG